MDLLSNSKKIGVISDSHIPDRALQLPQKIFKIFNGCDAIIHCGDVVSEKVLSKLRAIAPLYAVKGNMDPDELDLPFKRLIKINNKFIIGVWHGNDSHFGLKEKIYKNFIAHKPCLLLHGHSHIPEITEYMGVKIFNPGSCTNGRNFNSVGILWVGKNEIIPEIVKI